MVKVIGTWKAFQKFALRHYRGFHHVHNATHLAYFATVATQGPYSVLAGCLFALGALTWALKLEEVTKV